MQLLSSSSVGIIGGADGPTSIMISGPEFPWVLVVGGIIVLAAVAGIIALFAKR